MRIKTRILFLLILLWILGLPAAHAGSGTNLSNEIILQNGILSLQQKDYDTAVQLAQYLLTNDPHDLNGYHLMAMALAAKNAYWDLIATAFAAEKNGVASSLLYEFQAQAFFSLGTLDAALMALTNMEKAWNKENASR